MTTAGTTRTKPERVGPVSPEPSHSTSCHDLYELPQPHRLHPKVPRATSCHDIYEKAEPTGAR